MASFAFRTPEVDSLGSNNPLRHMRRGELVKLAVKRNLMVDNGPQPTKDALIALIESVPEDQMISLERAKTLKPFSLKKVCKDHGIKVDKTSTREYMLTEYEKLLER
jgi:hypothetical protein